MFRLTSRGDFRKTRDFLDKASTGRIYDGLSAYGQLGVAALSASTPVASGATAAAWSYGIERKRGRTTIYWTNSNKNGGARIALLIQHGHGTGTGGYVSGRDYINPAIRPIFDKMAEDIWKKVTNG